MAVGYFYFLANLMSPWSQTSERVKHVVMSKQWEQVQPGETSFIFENSSCVLSISPVCLTNHSPAVFVLLVSC